MIVSLTQSQKKKNLNAALCSDVGFVVEFRAKVCLLACQ